MSTLVENVAKVTAAHAALKTAIAAKGVAVPDGTKLTGMPALVDAIQTGGTTEPTNARACFSADDYAGGLVVPKTMVVDMTAIDNLKYFFYDCQAITSLELPVGFGQNATSLYYCFYNCKALTSLTLPANLGKIATNLNACFYACAAMTSLELPAGFGQAATNLANCFFQCGSLTSLTLPDGFGNAATDFTNCFFSCVSMTSLTLPANFGQAAANLGSCFHDCVNLTALALPDGFGQNATSLYNCFYSCTKLTSLHLPAGFGQNSTNNTGCFDNCPALTDITGNPNFKASLSLLKSSRLTHDSLMIVINGLQTVEGKTLTLGTTNLAKLTDEEKKVATDKGWTLA